MKKLFLLAASAMMILASCSKTEVVYQDQDPQEIGLFSIVKKQTKAANSTTTFNHSNMIVAAYLAAVEGGTVSDYFSGTVFTKANDATYFTGGKYWPLQTATLNFLAVAPETQSNVATVFGVEVDDEVANFASLATVTVTNNKNAQTDVMYAAGTGTNAKVNSAIQAVDMQFKHALAWVNFAFKTTTDGVTININKVTVTAPFDGEFTVTNANYNSDGAQNPVLAWADKEPNEEKVVSEANPLTLTTTVTEYGEPGILVVPTSETNVGTTGVKFVINYTVTVGNDSQTYDYTYSTENNLSWEAGKKYTYNISIGLNQIEINPTVDNTWTASTPDVEIN